MEEPRRLGGRYELSQVLGRGGMAEVYLAHDTRLGRTVAVKTLRVDLARDPSFQARFRREAQSAASLNHPSIVAVYDTGEDYVDGVSIPYIVMEYVDGSTLRELLHSGRKLLPERALEMTIGILQALEYSHRSGIVHRDIKPANVMLTRTGQVKVMDFGIARAMGDSGMTMTQTAAVIGTAQYLSPEQAKGETVDARSDLYSTGCLLFELLTVRPPFVGDSPVAVAYQHVREEPQPPSVYDPEISPEMDAIVLKALTKDPDYRYQSADEMRADIEACLDGQPVAATAMMGSVGYGTGYASYGDGASTATMSPQEGQKTSMLPPMREDDGGYGYDGGAGRRRPGNKSNISTMLLVVASVLVLVGAIFLGQALFRGKAANDSIDLPNFVGQTKTKAEAMAKNGNVAINWGTPTFCDDQAKNLVCKQTPSYAANTQINKDAEVTLFLSKGKETVQVPEVTGDKENDAKQQLEDKGFKVETTTEESTSADEGTVLKQNPAGGKSIERGGTVTITVAKAPSTIELPNVVGQNASDAESILKRAGFTNITTQQQSSNEDQDKVIAQSPDPFQRYAADTQITLTVSSGPSQSTSTVPNVVGQTLRDAKQLLAAKGFTNLQLTPNSSNNDNAQVINQDPAANTPEADPGSVTVTLTTADSGGNGNGGGGGGGGFFGGTAG
jgi:beta-lactam-binding protein with PASTA domain/predicted Ser/Thr protein kinase